MSYRLSGQAAMMERQREAARSGNVVPMRRAAAVDLAPAERRAISFEDLYGSAAGTIILGGGATSAADVVVTPDNALEVPAVAAAVNVLTNAVAGLPLPVYRRRRDGSRERERGRISRLLGDAANETLTSFEWRRALMVAKLTTGRGMSYIERGPGGQVLAFWPMDPARVTVRRDGFRKVYEYRDGIRSNLYQSDEVIDLPFMLKGDGLTHRGPVSMGKDAIGLAIALTRYGSRYFSGGGVPPFAIEGNFQTPAGMQRAADDLAAAVRKAASDSRQALVMPPGHKITPIGGDPEKAQMEAMQRFCVEQIARLYSLPPVFLQDLTHGTFTNTEQADLHFVKHALMHHLRQFEQELNLKVFGVNSALYAEFNVDGMQRGDFTTRMDGWAKAIQAGFVMPSEAREAENWPAADGAARLFVQGAMVPITDAGAGIEQGGGQDSGTGAPGDSMQ